MREPCSGSDPGRPGADETRPDRFARLVDHYGAAGFARVRSSRAAVIGLGGVGAHAAIALARSGVGSLLLVDFDVVTESSLNRSPVAGPTDVGRPKVDVVAEHLARACPDTRVETSQDFCHAETVSRLLDPRPDIVCDAIDSLAPKLALLVFCATSDVPVVSSMGASSRRSVTGLRAGDISKTRVCPLARRVRLGLRRRGITEGIACVWSEEPGGEVLPPDLGDRLHERGRVRHRLPSQISLPGMFGYALAALALERLAARS